MHLLVSSLPLTPPTRHTPDQPPHLPPIPYPSGPIIFSHDTNPFDAHSTSFSSNPNTNISAPVFDADRPFNGSPMARYVNVLPLARSVRAQPNRQDRVLVFRPLFVYRQEQAKKNQMGMRPPQRPPYYPYTDSPYAPPFNYPPGYYDLYDSAPYYDLAHNELPHEPVNDWYNQLPASHFWQKK